MQTSPHKLGDCNWFKREEENKQGNNRQVSLMSVTVTGEVLLAGNMTPKISMGLNQINLDFWKGNHDIFLRLFLVRIDKENQWIRCT